MMITIIEAQVPASKWNDLEIEYRKKIRHVPPQLLETYLIHDINHPDTWRILSIWRSKEAYNEAVHHGIHETCMEIFNNLDIEATRRVFDVPAHHVVV